MIIAEKELDALKSLLQPTINRNESVYTIDDLVWSIGNKWCKELKATGKDAVQYSLVLKAVLLAGTAVGLTEALIQLPKFCHKGEIQMVGMYGFEKVVTDPLNFAGQICAAAHGALKREGDKLLYTSDAENMGASKWQDMVKSTVEISNTSSTYLSLDAQHGAAASPMRFKS